MEENVDFAIILVRPRGARNVGAIARVMSHFGVSDLRLVSPQCDVKSVEARSMAMNAQPLLAGAEHFASLREASHDCGWLVGTSRRLGRKRQPTMRPREDAGALLKRASSMKVGLVFGQEDKGLFTEELSLCQEKTPHSGAAQRRIVQPLPSRPDRPLGAFQPKPGDPSCPKERRE